LKGLYVSNNQITTLTGSCIGELRSLERLDLSNNLLKALESTIEQLVGLSRLESLDLYGNALADVLNYRFYVIYHMPWLHLLDCHAVTDEQRVTAKRLFGTPEENAVRVVLAKNSCCAAMIYFAPFLVTYLTSSVCVRKQFPTRRLALRTDRVAFRRRRGAPVR